MIGDTGRRRLFSPLGVLGHSKSLSLDQSPASQLEVDCRTIGTGAVAGANEAAFFCGASGPDSSTSPAKISDTLRRRPANDRSEPSLLLVDSVDGCVSFVVVRESNSFSDTSGGESERVELETLVQLVSLSVRWTSWIMSASKIDEKLVEKRRPI
jgi:hypothetical protein